MYVGVLTVIPGWAALFQAPSLLLYALAAAAVLHVFVVLHEEHRLSRIFRTEHENYRSRVGRWLPTLEAPG
jgi:protein-S-isoprenylcysteine O-methyltransferase Ste14